MGGTDARLISEFMALANRIEDLRSEVIRFIEESRAIEIQAIESAVGRSVGEQMPAAAVALIASSLALTLSRERQLGVSLGHDAILAVVDAFLAPVNG